MASKTPLSLSRFFIFNSTLGPREGEVGATHLTTISPRWGVVDNRHLFVDCCSLDLHPTVRAEQIWPQTWTSVTYVGQAELQMYTEGISLREQHFVRAWTTISVLFAPVFVARCGTDHYNFRQEHKKILFYYPADADIDTKIKNIGLCEAIIKFTK